MWKCSVFNLHPTPSKYLPSVSSPQPHFTRVCSSDRTAQQRNGLEGVAELNVCIVQTRRTMQRIKEAWPVRISLISLVLCCSYCEWGALWIIGISRSDSVVDVYLPQAFVFIQPWKYQELLVQRFIHFSFHHFICIENQTKVIPPSFHPSVFFCLSGPRSQGQ